MQARGGKGRSGQTSVLRGKDFRNERSGQPALAGLADRADDRPNHVLEKPVAANTKHPRGVVALPFRRKDRSDAVFDLCCRCAKRREIVRAQKLFRGRIDGSFVERIAKGMNVPAMKRAHDRMAPEVVFIRLGFGGMTRMKIRADLFDGHEANFPGQERVAAAKHRVAIHGPFGEYACHLRVGMDAGVRPSRSDHMDSVIEKLLKCGFKLALNRRNLRLNLPPVESGAVVRKSQLEVSHVRRL